MEVIRKNLLMLSGHAVFAALFYLALHGKFERLFVDSSYYIAKIINDENIFIDHYRFICLVSQLLPLAGIKLGLSLSSVISLYSLSDMLFYYGLFLFIGYKLRQPWMALAVTGVVVTGVKYMFLCPGMVQLLGGALLVLFMVLYQLKMNRTNLQIAGLILLEFIIIFSHPLMFIPLFFVLGIEILRNGKITKSEIILLSAGIFLTVLNLVLPDEYNNGKINYAFSIDQWNNFKTAVHEGFVQKLFNLILEEYWIVVLMAIAVIVLLLIEKKRIAAVAFAGGITAYLLLVSVTQSMPFSSNYSERMYYTLVPMILIPFFIISQAHLKKVSLQLIIFIIVSSAGIFTIRTELKHLQTRTDKFFRTINYCRKFPERKFIMEVRNDRSEETFFEWSLPIESIILSSLAGADSTITIASEEDWMFNNSNREVKPNEFILRRDEIKSSAMLNQKYFRLANGNYHLLNSLPDNNYSEKVANSIQITMDSVFYFSTDSIGKILVTVLVADSLTLHSGLATHTPLQFCYHLYHADTLYKWDGERTPLEVDISGSYRQNIKVLAPRDTGEYVLAIDLIHEHIKWFGVNAKTKIIVRPNEND